MKDNANFVVRYADHDDATVTETFLIDVFEAVHDRMMAAYRADVPEIVKIHPRTLINMIASNVVVNLVRNCLIPASTVNMRMEAIEDTIDELTEMIRFVWQAFETTLAPEDKPN